MPAPAIPVWDPLVRIVHWGVACLVVIELFNEAGANPWHRYLGYAAGALVTARLAWGVFGSPYARFSSMAQSAKRVVPYLTSAAARGEQRNYAGHNPLGAWMALALWAQILLVVMTGWMQHLDAFWGDETVQSVHAVAAYVLAACAILHISGVLVTSAMTTINMPFISRSPGH